MKRRQFISQAVAAVAATSLARPRHLWAQETSETGSRPANHIRQSIMGWCFQPMDMLELAQHCKRIGLEAMEGIDSKLYDQVTDMGLKISLVGSHGFAKGPIDPDNHAEVESKLRKSIDLAVKYNAPAVITFTGMKQQGINDAAARKNCLDCWKRVIPYAEEKGITLVLEHLNSKAHLNPDGSVHPMKGHPGYWGDDVHLCAELINELGSERFKLLFDIYHVQIMNGDLIANLRRYQSIIGHYHTAGNPGRRELDERNEINYPAVMRAILDTGYTGYVAQEFIPTSDNPIDSLEQAYQVCDV
ncbi:TIM barrel protein [Roseiconus lacunae]|uniref:TIM barrel protein n=1 Tax=Roseiconus lacunae TaxID=2605694 RepID=A0ABT7PBZ5_9BACT|nr:TIM barrel protein [Roseiconus lacunae]MCD0463547.1 TIM barrel protein [Roseiconus lacunae]MDM4014004.1 TIM barrel protein [Roseiconus lacunae]WRQ53297.1 TIM barrel protein [Stieleria sp. HD01]